MPVLTAEDQQTGAVLQINADRLDGVTRDGVLRVLGERPGGGSIDATFVQVDQAEAKAVGDIARVGVQPSDRVVGEIARDVQAAFLDRLGGRDAQQIAQIAARAIGRSVAPELGEPTVREGRVRELAVRFDRAALQAGDGRSLGTGNGGTAQQVKER